MGEGVSSNDFDCFPEVVMSHLGVLRDAFCVSSVVELHVCPISVVVICLWSMLPSALCFILVTVSKSVYFVC